MGPVDVDETPDAVSEAGALVRLGLKVAFGTRGKYLAEYLDERRIRNATERVMELGHLTEQAGVSPEDILRRVGEDDDAAEFVEHVVQVAASTRYRPKLRYLARCLANSIRTNDDAVPSMDWAKIDAVRDLEAIHVRLLHNLKSIQDRRLAQRDPRIKGAPPPVQETFLIEAKQDRIPGLPASTFHAVMPVLVRNGLVIGKQSVDVDIEIELDVKSEYAEAQPSTTVQTLYSVSDLGLELLNELAEELVDDPGEEPS